MTGILEVVGVAMAGLGVGLMLGSLWLNDKSAAFGMAGSGFRLVAVGYLGLAILQVA